MPRESLSRTLVAPESPLVYLSSHYIQAKEYLEAIVASTSDAICTTDLKGHVIFFNPGAEKMLGLKSREIVGLSIHDFYEGGKKEAQKIMKLLMEHGKISNFETVMSANGRKVHVSMSAALLKDRDGRLVGTLGISKDITQRVELERRLRELSITDNLTGLYNQRHFQEKLASEIQRAKRQRDRLSLVLIDMDHFKEVNDRNGHLEGDNVLKQLAKAITKSIRGRVDMGFRYGGDEFIVLLPGLTHKKAEIVARRIQENFACSDGKTAVSFSHGVASLQPDDASEELLHRADQKMYKAKNTKRRIFLSRPQ